MENLDKTIITPLGEKVVKGSLWILLSRFAQQIFYLIRTIVLARLLSPNDFGLFGIALLILSTLDTFSQTGFKESLIQKKEHIKAYLDTVWTVEAARGVLIAIILFATAPIAAGFFNEPKAELIMKIIGLSIVLQGFTNVSVIYFQKELEFHKYFTFRLAGTFVDFLVAISAAFILRSAWALILGALAGSLSQCLISYRIDSYRPRLHIDLSKVKELSGFGKWIFSSGVLIFLLIHGDDIFVGKLLGAAALGFYQMAYLISNLPATEITHMISNVTFPAYSKIQDQISRLRNAYFMVLRFTVLLTFPISGLIFILAPDFTKIFLGAKWMPMVPAMQVLCIFGAARSLNAAMGAFFQGIGRPKIITIASGFQVLILGAIIYPLTNKYGILGTSLAIVMPNILATLFMSNRLLNLIDCRFGSFVKLLLPQLLGSLVMLLGIYFYKSIFIDITPFISFLTSAILGITIYCSFLFLVDKVFNGDLLNITSQIIKAARGSDR